MKHGVKLETLSWVEAERWFTANPVIVIPLGAAAKEHGPHLPLNNDAIIAGWLAEQVRLLRPVVIAPLINASFYPAFVEYPGSISLRTETARDVIVDTCNSLAAFGRGARDAETLQALQQLCTEADKNGFNLSRRVIDAALEAG